MKPALFIDRDRTINKVADDFYCKSTDDISVYEDVYEPLKELCKIYYIIIITNQSGIARGYFKENDLKSMNDKIKMQIEENGGRIDAIYYCPHTLDSGCNCRKPNTGMLKKATHDFPIDINNSFVIGDADVDIAFAENAGIRSIRVRGGAGIKNADFNAKDFFDVLRIIKREGKL